MPSLEAKRLEALYALEILDTPREERFDRITRTAVRLFRMPKSLLAFVDETRAWVKSDVGTSIDWVSRESSFSELAIESDEPLVVPDARMDPRFVEHPLVVGPDQIRSLAAHPLRTPDRYRVGALMVMDSQPDEFRRSIDEADEHPEEDTRFLIKQHYLQVRDLEVYAAPVTDREGRDLGRLHTFRDVTRERDRMKDEFVSLVSHELRTPLTSIKGYVDLLIDGDAGEVTEEQREFLDIVKNNSDRLVLLVNDLLDVSRIEAGRINLHVQPVDLAGSVDEVATSLRPLMEQKRQSLKLELPADLPQVRADRDRVAQIMTNLLSNAHKYTLEGSAVSVRALAVEDEVQVEVSDI